MQMTGRKEATLIISESYQHPDAYTASGFLSPDPFILLQLGRRMELYLAPFEVPRARKESHVNHVHDIHELGYVRHTMEQPDSWSTLGACAAELLEKHLVRTVKVPPDFPLAVGEFLQKRDLDVSVDAGFFESRRLLKDEREVSVMQLSMNAAEAAIKAVRETLTRTDSSGKHLKLDGKNLTSESLILLIEQVLLRKGCGAQDIIAAGGTQGADPHQRGSGPLRSDSPIIIDVFPYHKQGRYCGDMTRTFVAGEPSAEVRDMHGAVLGAQELALEAIRPGVKGDTVHNMVCDYFESRGYGTQRKGSKTGFIHGLGHGVGLEVHERPYLRIGGEKLRAGMCVTVEPGLYDPSIGGVRIEDLVLVTRRGIRNLASLPKGLEVF